MTDLYNNEKIVVRFTTKRKLKAADKGANMVANCLLGREKTSGVEPDVYTLILTDKTFFAEYTRTSLYGDKPEKVTKLNIPRKDIVRFEVITKDREKYLYILSDWGKEYCFILDSPEKEKFADEMKQLLGK